MMKDLVVFIIMKIKFILSEIYWYNKSTLANGTFIYLNLHPASKIVSKEICGHGVKHINLIWTECYSFFIEIIPKTAMEQYQYEANG